MKLSKITPALFCLLVSIPAMAQNIPPTEQPVRRSFFPALMAGFTVTGTTTFGLEQTFCPDNQVLTPGLVPGMRPTAGFNCMATNGVLKTLLETEFYYNTWDRLRAPFTRFELYHEIVAVNLGDFYESKDPLSLYHCRLRGGGVATFFDIFDNLINVNLKFRYGTTRAGSRQGERLTDYYRVEDSLGIYPTNVGYAHFTLSSERYRAAAGLLVLTMEDFTKYIGTSNIFSLYPRRNRLYGMDFNYDFPDELADCAAKIYISSFRRNTNDATVRKDQVSPGIMLEARGRRNDWGYHGRYQLIGSNYFTGGNPYLPVDKHGLLAGGNYVKKGFYSVTGDAEFYYDNLGNDPRRPTIKTLILRSKFSLRKDRLPAGWAALRFKTGWSDSVVVDLVPAGMTIDDEATRKKSDWSLALSVGGDHTWRNSWNLWWSEFCLYRDRSHYEHKLPRPTGSNDWITGVRNRLPVRKDLTLLNGLNVRLSFQEAGGLDEESAYLTSGAEYQWPARPLKVAGELGLLKQWSGLAERDYGQASFSLKPRYVYRQDMAFEMGYYFRYYFGRTRDYTANTIKAQTEWLF